MKKIKKVILIILGILIISLCLIYINHRIQLKKESELLMPPGQLVEVDGHNMSIYSEGTGDQTLIFMSGGGTCSPIFDFKSLYSLLNDKYRVVVVEKFGYGFSDIVDQERDISSILDNTRTALKSAGIEAPYILCPHSMSGIEALYWAQQYPEEISAIIGLDMSVPQAYENYKVKLPLLKLAGFAANIGITRIIPGLAESDAIKHGTLTDEEKEIYRAIFYNRTATPTMINEAANIKENARIVAVNEVPQIPILLFTSDGDGTGYEKETWQNFQRNYVEKVEGGIIIELDCPHYVHDYEYELISKKIIEFISNKCE
ncbi:MAG TPA: alpha/beta hydrolase [Clostridiaceae bacterium]|nr:alpha/beta hydrolase [Clostridiaceae bacterium]